MTGGLTLTYLDPRNRGRRVHFEPRSIGGWDRAVAEFADGRWRTTGTETVTSLTLEIDQALVADSVATDGAVTIQQNNRHGTTVIGR